MKGHSDARSAKIIYDIVFEIKFIFAFEFKFSN